LPYVEEQATYSLYIEAGMNKPIVSTAMGDHNYPGGNAPMTPGYLARTAVLPTFICPNEVQQPARDEMTRVNGWFARTLGNYRGCVGAGNMFGDKIPGDPLPGNGPFAGAFQVTRGQRFPKSRQIKPAQITDGTSHTLLFAEALTTINANMDRYGGVIGDHTRATMGGSMFSCYDTPNSSATDIVAFVACPPADGGYPQSLCANVGSDIRAYAAARSRHPGGVMVGFADGSVQFMTDRIALSTWRSLGTRDGGETLAGLP
jgi:prepilin-type processing-associated H-X9-DG protein